MSHTKITSSKKILQAPLFHIMENTIVTPNGKTHVHMDAYRKPIVSIFPMTDSYELYLISQYRVLFEKNLLEASAGHVEEGENFLHAAKRELQEETGIIADQWEQIATIDSSASIFKSQATIYLAKGLTFEKPNPEDDEEIELVKIPLDAAVQKVMSGEIFTSTTMIGILLLDKLRREKKL